MKQYYLNVSLSGKYWAKIILPLGRTMDETKVQAQVIVRAFSDRHNFEFDLVEESTTYLVIENWTA